MWEVKPAMPWQTVWNTLTINLSDEEIGTKLNNITYHKWETIQEEHKGKLVSGVNLKKVIWETALHQRITGKPSCL